MVLSVTLASLCPSGSRIAGASTPAQPTVDGTTVSCTNTSGNVKASVVLKPGGAPFRLTCAGEMHLFPPPFAPDKEDASPSVCRATDVDNPLACLSPVALSDLIPGATSHWVTAISRDQGATLTIPTERFPLTAQTFAVGCIQVGLQEKDTRVEFSCMVTVTVEPREATVLDNIVRCSYPESKETSVPVTLTPSARSFELVCGTGNKPQPVEYTKQFCSGPTVKGCTAKPYSDLFSGFKETWWSTPQKTDGESAAKFEIPESRFPGEKKTFLVGCEATTSKNQKVYCSVPVTVYPKGGSEGGGTSATVRADGRGALLLGIVVLVAGVFAGPV